MVIMFVWTALQQTIAAARLLWMVIRRCDLEAGTRVLELFAAFTKARDILAGVVGTE
jgi:hypothetical protein